MYLFVFVFIFLAILGLYTELLLLRLSQIGNSQTIVAESMSTWHDGAVSMLLKTRAFRDFAEVPCFMTEGFTPLCEVEGGLTYVLNMAEFDGRYYLPSDYNYNDDLKWRTIFYREAGGNSYLLTYVHRDEVRIGFTTTQIHQQLQRTTLPKISYGIVAQTTCLGGGAFGTWLVTNHYSGSGQICYPVPPGGDAGPVPAGSVGIISILGQ
ncbi:MAG: hypothetical protein FWF24_06975 [Alphaproteobacteria bacterium]|nr:hypothetical protein [Alphaproteobacteria bacterium]